MTGIRTFIDRLAAAIRGRRDTMLRRRITRLLASHHPEAVPFSLFAPTGGEDAGHLGYDMGRLDVSVTKGRIITQWTGRGEHAVSDRWHVTNSIDGFMANLRSMTTRHFVYGRRPSAGPHHMIV